MSYSATSGGYCLTRIVTGLILAGFPCSSAVANTSSWLPPLTYYLLENGNINQAPQLSDDAFDVFEDQSTLLDVLANDQDPQGDSLKLVWLGAQIGTAQITSDNQIQYQPPENFSGQELVIYRATDGKGGTQEAQVTITVTPVNDAPVAQPDSFELASSGTLHTLDVLANDSDIDGDSLHITAAQATLGEVSISTDNKLLYRLGSAYRGVDTISYSISDGDLSTAGTVNISLTPVNNEGPKIIGQQDIFGQEDIAFTINVEHLSIEDPDSTAFNVTLMAESGPNYRIVNGKVQPSKDYFGTVLVPVSVSDGLHQSQVYYASITFEASNDAPRDPAQMRWPVDEDASTTLNFRAMFYDPEAQANPELLEDFTYQLMDTSFVPLVNGRTAHGTLLPAVGRDHGWFTYKPDPGFVGSDAIFFFVYDELGARSTRGDLIFDVNAVQGQAPKIQGQRSLQMDEEASLTLQVSDFQILDPDSSSFTLSVNPQGTNYSAQGNQITAKKDFFGQLSVPVRVFDGKNWSPEFGAVITVNNINDPPQVFDYTLTVERNQPSSAVHFRTGMMYDPDAKQDGSLLDQFSYQFVTQQGVSDGRTAHGQISQVTNMPHGVFSYQPDTDYVGLDIVNFWVTDEHGLQSEQGTITYKVLDLQGPVTPPEAVDVTQDGDTFHISWPKSPYGQAAQVRYQVNIAFNGGQSQLLTQTFDTKITHKVEQQGTYQFLVATCLLESGTRCSTFTPGGYFTYPQGMPSVEQFEWIPAKVKVGQPTTFYWNILNVNGCTATTAGNGANPERQATGESGPWVYFETGSHTSKWYCTDQSGNRYPASGYLEATRTVEGLGAPVLNKK
nr:tandem-95 repeat protein [Aliiglaciecola sp. CAU 1673]